MSIPPRARTIDPASIAAVRGASLIFVGGKGGVGKTTVAAAIALALARAERRNRLLLLSTDPAHSLGDLFRSRLDDEPRLIAKGPANLFVRELNAAAALARRRQACEAAFGEMTSSLGGPPLSKDGGAAADLITLAPPGVDELFGMLSVLDARPDYDTIVVDTAPTGHALRLLELPQTARAWVQLLLRLLLKYRRMLRPGTLAAELVDLSKSIRDLQMLLRDRQASRFVVVARAAELSRHETGRLIAHLERLRLSVPAVVVNGMTMAPGSCRRCRQTLVAERRQASALRRVAGRRVIIRAPLAAPAPRGVRAIERWARCWMIDGANGATPLRNIQAALSRE